MKKFIAAFALAAMGLGLASTAEAKVRIGTLRCVVEGGPAYVVGSSRAARCVFYGNSRHERYFGKIDRVGLDIGYNGPAVILWGVFAPSDAGPRVLRGRYVGVSADASLGVGGGGNVLVGGSSRTVSLQPLSVKTQTGVSLAAGVGDLVLR